jgi:hypothetical protein
VKHIPTVVGILLALVFLGTAPIYFFDLVKMDPPPEGSFSAHFFAAFGPSGYLAFVKILEVIGGVLVAIPRTRNLGLLILGPIIINILAYSIFIAKGVGMLNPMTAILVLAPLYLLWVERRAWCGLAAKNR